MQALAAALALAVRPASALPGNQGNVSAVYDLLERVLPGSSSHFALSFTTSCPGAAPGQACFQMQDGSNGQVTIAGTSASELTAAIGIYFRQYCNMTIGWSRGGGSNIFTPNPWPAIGGSGLSQARSVPYSYIENVCTHSYSLVWFDWNDWSDYIDWMALTGINLNLAMTGQEESAYQVFSALGLDDFTIRSWFNGPAFLTWSRGQNEYGNNIAGPLPRSWMQGQWQLQQQILARSRSLGIASELPGFQGNVPWALSTVQKDANLTQQGDTGWMNSVDPLFGKIADMWMKQICSDFGCVDHIYQLDGYFSGGTAPWAVQGVGAAGSPGALAAAKERGSVRDFWAKHGPKKPVVDRDALDLPNCTWSTIQNDTYLADCDITNCASYPTVQQAMTACIADWECGGITSQAGGQAPWELRQSNTPAGSPSNEATYYITNLAACRGPAPPITPDPVWMERGAAAYMGLNRTDPDAVWSFQGWAIVGWNSWSQGSSMRGFVDSVPAGKFLVIDMSVNGEGEWQQWSNAAFFGAQFIWTTLHDFGGECLSRCRTMIEQQCCSTHFHELSCI